MKSFFTKKRMKEIIITLIFFCLCGYIAYMHYTPTGNFSISPYPEGKDFALSIVDDTDFSIGPDIKPVYDLLFELGFRTTKTVWVFDQKHSNTFRKENEEDYGFANWGHSLENKNYLELIKVLDARGFEIGLHGISAGNDYRNEIIAGYEEFNRIFGRYPKIDILHAENIENIYAGNHKLDIIPLKIVERFTHNSDYRGHIENSQYFWGDICQKYIRYVRLPFHAIKEINLLKINPNFPFHDPERPYVNYWFPNSDGSDYNDFMDLTSQSNIKRLIKERGTTIIYTHFANHFADKVKGNYILKPEFKKRMEYIRKFDGWFVTTTEILDRFVEMKNVILLEMKQTITVVNSGEHCLSGVTLLSAPGIKLYDLRNNLIIANDQGEIVIGDLPLRSTITFYKKKLIPSTIVSNEPFITRWERMKIEMANYMGELF